MRKIIHAVRGWITNQAPKGRNTAIVYTHTPGKEAPHGELNANDQIAILRRLSSFVGKETIPVTVIFQGRPSRSIPDGTKQSGVEARYATGDQLRKVVMSAISEARKTHSPVLATNLPDMEKVARSERIRHIRASTFEETLDTVCGPLRRDQPQQQRRPQPQKQAQQQQQSQAPIPVAPQAAPEQAEEYPAPAEPQPSEPKPAESTRPEAAPRRLQRHEPSVKKEIKDQAILDLIDPL